MLSRLAKRFRPLAGIVVLNADAGKISQMKCISFRPLSGIEVLSDDEVVVTSDKDYTFPSPFGVGGSKQRPLQMA